MPSYNTPKRGVAFQLAIGLVDQANTKLLKVNPTIAAGDFQISKDFGAFANLATLPTVLPAGSRSVQINLSIAEMTADNIVIQCVDAAGAEWCDQMINLQTTVSQLDDLATATNLAAAKAVIDAILLDTAEIGTAGAGLTALASAANLALVNAKTTNLPTDPADQSLIIAATDAIMTRLGAPAGASLSADLATKPAASAVADAVWDEVLSGHLTAGTTGAALSAASAGGGGGLDAAGVRAAIGLATANLDTQLDALPTAAENADAVWDEVVDGAVTARQSMRLQNSALGGESAGLDTDTAVFRDLADTKARITATVDASGNRSVVTRDLT